MVAHARSIELLGYIGGFITSSAIWPQIYKSAKHRATKDFSWPFLCTFMVGVTINFIFGIIIQHPAVFLGAAYSFATNAIIMGMKVYHEYGQVPMSKTVVIVEEDPSNSTELSQLVSCEQSDQKNDVYNFGYKQ